MKTQEIECRFLEIDKEVLVKRLVDLGAGDKGEVLIDETIFYDQELKWRDNQIFVRLRKNADKIEMTYKNQSVQTVDGTFELDLKIDDYEKGILFFEKIGLTAFRRQQKKRHTFVLDGVNVDIDTWPKIPTYLELEGDSEEDLKKIAKKLGLEWEKADFHNARWVIENIYNIPVSTYKVFTFEVCE